jgi:hypothetical protein
MSFFDSLLGGGKKENPYTKFLTKHKGLGYTRDQLVSKYRLAQKAKGINRQTKPSVSKCRGLKVETCQMKPADCMVKTRGDTQFCSARPGYAGVDYPRTRRSYPKAHVAEKCAYQGRDACLSQRDNCLWTKKTDKRTSYCKAKSRSGMAMPRPTSAKSYVPTGKPVGRPRSVGSAHRRVGRITGCTGYDERECGLLSACHYMPERRNNKGNIVRAHCKSRPGVSAFPLDSN